MAAENETKPAAKKVISLTAECAENAEFLILSFPPDIPASWCGVNSVPSKLQRESIFRLLFLSHLCDLSVLCLHLWLRRHRCG